MKPESFNSSLNNLTKNNKMFNKIINKIKFPKSHQKIKHKMMEDEIDMNKYDLHL